jgi:AcrR family transcriptional regulator
LAAALELVVEVGYDNVSMDAIAERARSSKATIYRHWSGKAEVVAEAVRCRSCEQYVIPETGTLRTDLLAWLEGMADALNEQDGALMAAVVWAMRSDAVLADLMRSQMSEGKQVVVQAILDQAIARGEVAAATEPAVLLEVLQPMVLMRMIIQGEPLDEAFLTHLVDDVALRLLQPAKTT